MSDRIQEEREATMGTVHYLRDSDRRRPSHRRRRTQGRHPRNKTLGARGGEFRERGAVIPFPVHRTAWGRMRPQPLPESPRPQPKERFRPWLFVLALGALVSGLVGGYEKAWLAYAIVVVGLLGIIESLAKSNDSRGRRVLLGWAAHAIAIVGFLHGLPAWPMVLLFALGLVLLTSGRTRRERRIGYFD